MKTDNSISNVIDNESLEYLKGIGFIPNSDLNYCTDNGIEYYIGFKGKEAIVCAIIQDESIYFITKPELRQMSKDAKLYGINKVHLHTNYGIELHSRLEKPETIGFNSIKKIMRPF